MSRAAKLFALPLLAAALCLAVPRSCPAAGSCLASDVRAVCCPSACAAKASSRWTEADGILRGCMAGLGCGSSEIGAADVFMTCGGCR